MYSSPFPASFPSWIFRLIFFVISFYTFPNQLKRPSGLVINLAIWIAQRTHSHRGFPSSPNKKKKRNLWTGLSKRIFPVSLNLSGVFFSSLNMQFFLGIFSLKFEHFFYVFSASTNKRKSTTRRGKYWKCLSERKVTESQRNQPRKSIWSSFGGVWVIDFIGLSKDAFLASSKTCSPFFADSYFQFTFRSNFIEANALESLKTNIQP